MEHLAQAVRYLAVFLAGMIAGILFAIGIDHQRLSTLSASVWLTARHTLDPIFTKLMPWIWNISLPLLFASAYLSHGSDRINFLVAGLLLLMGIVVTLIVHVPINNQIPTWTVDAMPPNWSSLRVRWIRFHWLRTLLGIAAFACALVSLVR
jgi:uncharacterized membrane protein